MHVKSHSVLFKNWKTRLTAYEDLRKDLKVTLGDDPLFQQFGPFIPHLAII